jgi:hypothetical protein
MSHNACVIVFQVIVNVLGIVSLRGRYGPSNQVTQGSHRDWYFLFFGAIVAALAGTMLVMLARALPMPPSSAGVSMGRYAAAQQVTSSHHRYLGTIEVPMGSTEH